MSNREPPGYYLASHPNPILMLCRTIIALAILIAAVGVVEWYLGTRLPSTDGKQPNYHRLANAHAPYSVKYPHSSYGFFLPDSSEFAHGIPGEIVHLSPDGFRGPGPDSASGRPLAFLVGNSVVFGFVQHDSLTISGFLNRIQRDFYFVNAGVPSWVSSQMRRRITLELLAYQPALVLLWGGHNDAALAYSAAAAGQPFNHNLTEQPSRPDAGVLRLLKTVVPNLTARFGRLASAVRAPTNTLDTGVASAAADGFIANVEAAYTAASDSGARFLAVYQPILYHHDKRPDGFTSENRRLFFERFRERALSQAATSAIPLLDLSDFFDAYFTTVPVFTAGQGPDLNNQVFVDAVHLYVPGNELVARAINARLTTQSFDSLR